MARALDGQIDSLAAYVGRLREQKLPVESDQVILGTEQPADPDGIAPKHLGRNFRRIVAGTENDDLGAGNLPHQAFEIAVCRDQNEVVRGCVLQNPTIACTSKPVAKGTFRSGEEIAQQWNQAWRQAFVKEELHPRETLGPAANSAA